MGLFLAACARAEGVRPWRALTARTACPGHLIHERLRRFRTEAHDTPKNDAVCALIPAWRGRSSAAAPSEGHGNPDDRAVEGRDNGIAQDRSAAASSPAGGAEKQTYCCTDRGTYDGSQCHCDSLAEKKRGGLSVGSLRSIGPARPSSASADRS